MAKTLIQMIDEVYVNNVDHGWFDHDRTVGDDVALLHSEVSEFFEEWRKGNISEMHLEAADILIRLLDTCYRAGIDLEASYETKMEKNRNRPYKHGQKAL